MHALAFFAATLAEHRFGGWVTFEDDTALHALFTALAPAPAPAAAADDHEAATLPLDRLDALEVALRFEVGGLSVSLGLGAQNI